MIKFDKTQFFVGSIFFSIIISLSIYTYFRNKEISKCISENKVITVGKVYKFSKTRSFDYYYYCYYYEGSFYSDKLDKSGLEEDKLVGKFFFFRAFF